MSLAVLLAATTTTCRAASLFANEDRPPHPAAPPAEGESSVATPQQQKAEVGERLKAAERLLAELIDTESEEAEVLKLRIEQLTRLELVLAQWITELERGQEQEVDAGRLESELRELNQGSIGDSEPTSFLLLDDLQDELAAEQRRNQRLQKEAASAKTDLDSAKAELDSRERKWRNAKEALERQNSDVPQRAVQNRFDQASLARDLARAIVGLRKAELASLQQSLTTHQRQIELLEARVDQLQQVAVFSQRDLQQELLEIDRKEAEVKRGIDSAQRNLDILDGRLTNFLPQSPDRIEDSPIERAKLDSQLQLRRRFQEEIMLLQGHLVRLTDLRIVWTRRQLAASQVPSRNDIRQWIDQAETGLQLLARQQRAQLLDIDEIRVELAERREQSSEAESAEPQVAHWIDQQITHLQKLLEQYEHNLSSIRSSERLHRKLLSELESDSLAVNATDRLLDVWNGVLALWNYEIAAIQDRPITIKKVVKVLAILLTGVLFSRWLSRWMGQKVLHRLNIDPSASATIQSLFYYTLLMLFILFAMHVINVPWTAFTVVGGALALGIGFGSQNVINNFISGLILQAERPVKVGDLVQIDQLYGNVEHIGARSTRIRTGSNLEIIVPNSTFLQDNVVNFTLSSDKVRTSVKVGVVYGSPTVTVAQLIRRAVLESGRVAREPPPIILFHEFGDNSLEFEVHFWIRMRTIMDRLQVESAVRFRIEQLFREEGIVIAFPQRDVHLDSVRPVEVRLVDAAARQGAIVNGE